MDGPLTACFRRPGEERDAPTSRMEAKISAAGWNARGRSLALRWRLGEPVTEGQVREMRKQIVSSLCSLTARGCGQAAKRSASRVAVVTRASTSVIGTT